MAVNYQPWRSHVVLGVTPKHIFGAFEEEHTKLVAQSAKGADPGDSDEYCIQSIFWVSRYSRLQVLP